MNRHEWDAPWCWACGDYVGLDVELCMDCGAPPWAGEVVLDEPAVPGVYFLASKCGMWKVGVSSKDLRRRADALSRLALKRGEIVVLVGCMPWADARVERWIHGLLAESRDRSWARAEYLPHPSEWFWPTPALYALVYGELGAPPASVSDRLYGPSVSS